MPAFFNTLDFPSLPIPATSPCFSAASVMFWLIKLFGIKSTMYQLNLIWEMHSHFIISELQIVRRCLCICEWINTCLEETLLQIIIGLFPSICIRVGYQYMVTNFSLASPALAGTLTPSIRDSWGVRLDLLISVAITVMLCHSNVSRSRSFDVKIEPFPESMLNILSISVCRSTEYLKRQSRI